MPVATVGGVLDVPQISYWATSKKLDDLSDYPRYLTRIFPVARSLLLATNMTPYGRHLGATCVARVAPICRSCGKQARRSGFARYLSYISPVSRSPLLHTSTIYQPYIPHISRTSRLHPAYISPISSRHSSITFSAIEYCVWET